MQHDARGANANLGMHDFSIRALSSHELFRPKSVLVPLDGFLRVIERQRYRYRRKSFWNCFFCFCHESLLLMPAEIPPAGKLLVLWLIELNLETTGGNKWVTKP